MWCTIPQRLGDVLVGSDSSAPVQFGNFELDLRTGELRCDVTPVKLQPQPAKLLALLVSHAGEVVTREGSGEARLGVRDLRRFRQGPYLRYPPDSDCSGR